MSSSSEKSVVLGAEYDQRLRAVVKNVLGQLGVKELTHEWVVGGSQEIETVEVRVAGQRLVLEAETYIGLSVRGPSDLVDHVYEMVKEQLSITDSKKGPP